MLKLHLYEKVLTVWPFLQTLKLPWRSLHIPPKTSLNDFEPHNIFTFFRFNDHNILGVNCFYALSGFNFSNSIF